MATFWLSVFQKSILFSCSLTKSMRLICFVRFNTILSESYYTTHFFSQRTQTKEVFNVTLYLKTMKLNNCRKYYNFLKERISVQSCGVMGHYTDKNKPFDEEVVFFLVIYKKRSFTCMERDILYTHHQTMVHDQAFCIMI